MSRFEAATSISTLWKSEQGNVLPFLRHVTSDQLANSEPQHDLLSHTLHVRNLGYAIGLQISKLFPNIVDPDLIASACMIHDWGKISQAPTINKPYSHYVRSQFDTAIQGFPAIGSIAGRHNFGALLREDSLLLEQMILIYSDVRSRTVSQDNRPIRTYKSLSDALPEIEEKLVESGKYSADDIERGKQRLLKFEETLRHYGVEVDNITDIPDNLTPSNRVYYNPPLPDDSGSSSQPSDGNEFVSTLDAQGIITLHRETFQKSLQHRHTIREAAAGNSIAAQRLALIDPRRSQQWLHTLYQETRSATETYVQENFNNHISLIKNPHTLHKLRANYIAALEDFYGTFTKEQQMQLLSVLYELISDPHCEDDVAHHAASALGYILGNYGTDILHENFDRLWQEFMHDTPGSYAPTVLMHIIKQTPYYVEPVTRKIQEVPLESMGIRTLRLYASALQALNNSSEVKAVVTQMLNGRETPTSNLYMAYILARLLDSPSRYLRIEATAGLVNIHQRSNNVAIKLYIEGLLDSKKRHTIQYHEDVITEIQYTEDPVTKMALCDVLGRFAYGEEKELVQNSLENLLAIIDSESDNDVIIAALQALGRSGITPNLTTDQFSDAMKRLWSIFYLNIRARKLMPYFLAGMYAIRDDYPNANKDIDFLNAILQNVDHPDKHLQYETARFFVGLVGAISNDNDPRIRLAQGSLLKSSNISPQLFDIVFQKYVTRVLGSTRISKEQKVDRIMEYMARKYISAPTGDLVTRYLTYKDINERCQGTSKTVRDAVIFTGTFDPFHAGSENVAAYTSQFVGDVYVHADDGNPSKQPLTRSLRNEIITKAIADQPNVFLFNDPQPYSYRLPEEYSELRRVFNDRTLWLLIGEDRIRTSSYYANPKHYVYEVPHVLTIRSGNFSPSQMELRNGKVFGEVNSELLKYLQAHADLGAIIARFNRVKVIGVPVNFSSTEIKQQIQRGVLRNVDSAAIPLISKHYADATLVQHISEKKAVDDPGELDRKRQDDEFLVLPRDQVHAIYTSLVSRGIELPPETECQVFYDPMTGRGYLCQMKSLVSRTEKILEVVRVNASSLF